jgi:hypothetical protein
MKKVTCSCTPEERGVTKDSGAIEELQGLGYMTTTVTLISGAVVVSFDTAKIAAAFGS